LLASTAIAVYIFIRDLSQANECRREGERGKGGRGMDGGRERVRERQREGGRDRERVSE